MELGISLWKAFKRIRFRHVQWASSFMKCSVFIFKPAASSGGRNDFSCSYDLVFSMMEEAVILIDYKNEVAIDSWARSFTTYI